MFWSSIYVPISQHNTTPYQVKTPVFWPRHLLGDLKSINLEHLFDDLFRLKKKFEALGMVIKDNRVYIPDSAERDS